MMLGFPLFNTWELMGHPTPYSVMVLPGGGGKHPLPKTQIEVSEAPTNYMVTPRYWPLNVLSWLNIKD